MKVAEESNLSATTVALIVSHFFEGVADQVLMNRIVSIPGFGTFGAKTRFRRVPNKFFGERPLAFPAFVAATRFKFETRARVPAAVSPATDPMRRIVNSYRKGSARNDLAATFDHFREAIVAMNQPGRSCRHKIK
jgi:nucleoid DNA-binding protein